MGKIAVEGEDVAGIEFVCHLDQAGVGKVSRRIAIFPEDLLNMTNATSQLEGNLKRSVRHILQQVVCCAGDTLQQVAAFNNDRFTRYKRGPEPLQCGDASLMISISPIQPSHNYAAIQQYWPHLSGLCFPAAACLQASSSTRVLPGVSC